MTPLLARFPYELPPEVTGYCSELARRPKAPKVLLAMERTLGLPAKALESDASI